MKAERGRWLACSRRLSRRPVAVGLALALAVVAGCAAEQKRIERQEQMDAVAVEIQESLAESSDITSVEVGYSTYFTDANQATVSITVEAGTEFEPVITETVRRIWLSEFHPLYGITIRIWDAADNERYERRYLDADGQDQAELERLYGPRSQ